MLIDTVTSMSRSPGPRGVYAKTPQRREDILDAAFGVFARYGYLNSSMSEIAKRAGLTMPGVTHHFPTKSGLLEEVLLQRDLDAGRHLQNTRGVDFFLGLLEIAKRDESDPGLTQLFAILSAEATTEDHPAHHYFRDRYEMILANVRRALEDAAEHGELREGVDPHEAAEMYVALSDGLQLQRLYGVSRAGQSQTIRRYFEGILTSSLADHAGDNPAR